MCRNPSSANGLMRATHRSTSVVHVPNSERTTEMTLPRRWFSPARSSLLLAAGEARECHETIGECHEAHGRRNLRLECAICQDVSPMGAGLDEHRSHWRGRRERTGCGMHGPSRLPGVRIE